MDKRTAQRTFKKHYRYAMRLKEGGKAWEREVAIAEKAFKVLMGR